MHAPPAAPAARLSRPLAASAAAQPAAQRSAICSELRYAFFASRKRLHRSADAESQLLSWLELDVVASRQRGSPVALRSRTAHRVMS
jgi:hypothetical protein